MSRQGLITIMTAGAIALAAHPAGAATLSVDDDHVECPAAAYSSVQAAIDAANAGDIVAVCPGTYIEGPGTPGSNAITIAKSLQLRGAGADLVQIRPRTTATNQIADDVLDLRNGLGDVVVAIGKPKAPIDVTVSGVTVDGAGVYAEAGIVFLDARGAIRRSLVTNVVTSEAAASSSTPGGWRSAFPGVGIAHLSASADGATRELVIDHMRVEKYNTTGVLIDGDTSQAVIRADRIVGRTVCLNYSVDGNCSSPALVTTGPLFGQDGVRVTGGAVATMTDDTISQNLVHGSGAPVAGQPTNNANLTLGAGIRLVGGGSSSVTRSNIVDNAYGVFSDSSPLVSAENNWWGLWGMSPANGGPQISPSSNPNTPENPVNGIALPDQAGGTTSSTVDFFPFRSGTQSNPDAGQWPVVSAPGPVADAPPSLGLSAAGDRHVAGDTVELTADAGDDFGVRSVMISDSGGVIATLTQPPYSTSAVIPSDAGCGPVTYTATAEDSSGQTTDAELALALCTPPSPPFSEDSSSPWPASAPGGGSPAGTPRIDDAVEKQTRRRTRLTLHLARRGRAALVTGRLLALGKPALKPACKGKRVFIAIVRGHRVIRTRRVRLRANCAYRVRLRVPNKPVVAVRTRFRGTPALRPSRTKRRLPR